MPVLAGRITPFDAAIDAPFESTIIIIPSERSPIFATKQTAITIE
jgi:hypothetical protein